MACNPRAIVVIVVLAAVPWGAFAELPLFAPTYNAQQSTIAMPCKYGTCLLRGFFFSFPPLSFSRHAHTQE